MQSQTPAMNGRKREQRRPNRGHLVLVSSLPETVPASSSPAQASGGAPCPAERPAFARHLLTAIRVAMGLVFVVCGLNGFFDFLPRPGSAAHDSAFALGQTLLVAGSMLPLLKGSEVLLETLLDLYQELRSRGLGRARQFSPRSE